MNKTLALIAALGLVSAPVMAKDAAHAEKAVKVVAKEEVKKQAEDAKAGAKDAADVMKKEMEKQGKK